MEQKGPQARPSGKDFTPAKSFKSTLQQGPPLPKGRKSSALAGAAPANQANSDKKAGAGKCKNATKTASEGFGSLLLDKNTCAKQK